MEKPRSIQVGRARKKPYYPKLIFGGKYLLNLGFRAGDRVEIFMSANGLQIMKEGAKTDEIRP